MSLLQRESQRLHRVNTFALIIGMYLSFSFCSKRAKKHSDNDIDVVQNREEVKLPEGNVEGYITKFSKDYIAAVLRIRPGIKISIEENKPLTGLSTIVLNGKNFAGKTGNAYTVSLDGDRETEPLAADLRLITLCIRQDTNRALSGMLIGESKDRIAIAIDINSLIKKTT